MTSTSRHRQWTDTLQDMSNLGLPAGGISIMFSTVGRGVEAGCIWVGEHRPSVLEKVLLCGGDLNVKLGAVGEFVGLEMLRRITNAEVQRFRRWAHRRWEGPKDAPHLPCIALRTLLASWDQTARIAEPERRGSMNGVDQWRTEEVACR